VKVAKSKLKQIIKEELQKLLKKRLVEDVDWGTASSQDLVDIIGDENIAFDAEREMGAHLPDSAYADWLEAYSDPYHPEHDMAVAALPAINPASQDFMYPSKEERIRADRSREWEKATTGDPVVAENQQLI